jgi:hypothetical protein
MTRALNSGEAPSVHGGQINCPPTVSQFIPPREKHHQFVFKDFDNWEQVTGTLPQCGARRFSLYPIDHDSVGQIEAFPARCSYDRLVYPDRPELLPNILDVHIHRSCFEVFRGIPHLLQQIFT